MADRAQGYKYQLSVAAYLASLLSKRRCVKDYYIFYELPAEFNPYDDIVLAVKYEESEEFSLYFIQVKSGKIMLEINKYLDGYNKITQDKKWQSLENIDITENNMQFCYFASKNFRPQNISFLEDGQSKTLEIEDCKCNNSESIIDKNVCKLRLKDAGVTTNHKDFFDNFYIFLGQPDTDQIANSLRGMWSLNDAVLVIEYLDRYFKDKTASLSRSDFEHELLRIHLSDFIAPPTKVKRYKKLAALAWNDLTLSHNVTVVQNETHVETGLFGCIALKLDNIISIDEWNDFVDNGGRLSKEVRDQFTEKSMKPKTLKDLLIHLWTCKKIPLILKSSNSLPLLKDFSHLAQHYIIIDSDPSRRYNEMKNYNLNVVKNLGETEADALLQSVLVSMQGGKPASLYEVIASDRSLMESLTCYDIIKLIEPRQVYISSNCLERDLYMLFIIETANSKAINYEYYEPSGENISIYCELNRSNEVYEKVKHDPQFKNYTIYRLRLEEDKLMQINREDTYYAEGTFNEDICHENPVGLQPFLIDQYGNSVYSLRKDDAVPIIGLVKRVKCVKYLRRYMRKGTVLKREGRRKSTYENTDSNIKLSETIFPADNFFKQIHGKICVVTGEAGIGKTTLLKLLIQTSEPPYYVLFSNLAQFQVDMSKYKQKLLKNPVNYFWSKQKPFQSTNFVNVFLKAPKRLILILDAFDEVIATCKEQVLQLIKKLNEETCIARIIIGSRLLTVNLLNNQFEIDLVKLEGFSEEYNGSKYIENWGFDNDSVHGILTEFASNPLYLNMLRTISQTSDINSQVLNRWSLYKRIVESELTRFCHKILHVFDESEKENILSFHWELAIKLIFGSNRVTQKIFGSNKQKRFSNYARLGMIQYYDVNEEPVFIHHTFAEFFVVQWMIETTDKEAAKYIYEIMLSNDEFYVLRMHCEQFPLHRLATISDAYFDDTYLEQIEQLCKTNQEDVLSQTDGLGRTALHIAAIRYRSFNSKCLETIIRYTRERGYCLYPRDKLLNWTWIDYCERNSEFDITLISPEYFAIHAVYWSYYGAQARPCNISQSWEDITLRYVESMISRGCLINVIDDLLLVKYFGNKDFMKFRNLCLNSQTPTLELPKYFVLNGWLLKPLHVAAIYSNINIVLACIERGDDVNVVDLFECTPLYYSVLKQNSEIVRLLLEKNADIAKAPSQSGRLTAFQQSLLIENKNITNILIQNVDSKKFGSRLLYEAIIIGDLQVIEMLLNADVDPNGKVVTSRRSFKIKEEKSYILKVHAQLHARGYEFNTMTADELRLAADTCKDWHFSVRPLNTAIRAKRNDIVELLLRNGADVNLQDEEYADFVNVTHELRENTPLYCAIRWRNVDAVELLLKNSANVNYIDRYGWTPLRAAVTEDCRVLLATELRKHNDPILTVVSPLIEYNNITFIDTLLRYGADVNFKDNHILAPLDKEIATRNWVMDEILLRNGTDAHYLREYNDPIQTTMDDPLIEYNNLKLVETLLRYGADVNFKDNHMLTSLHHAIATCNWVIVENLLRNGADTDYLKEFDFTRVLDLLPADNTTIVELLLRNGADANFRTACDVTPLYVAARKRNPEVVKLLLEYGATENIVTCTNTLLNKAKENLDFDVVIWLLNLSERCSSKPIEDSAYPYEVVHLIQIVENQAKVNLIDEIDIKCTTTDVIVIDTLLNYGANLSNPEGMKYINAVLELNSEAVDQILIHNFTKHHQNEIEYYTAVGYAAKQRNKAMIEILTRNGDAREILTEALITVIQSMVDESVVEVFLLNQVDASFPNGRKLTLRFAMESEKVDTVKMLLENEVNINGISFGYTPLIAAILQNNLAITRILLDNGADVNFVCESGLTALYAAVLQKDRDLLEMLFSYGANSDIETSGDILLYTAIALEHSEIVSVLLSEEVDLWYRLNIFGDDGVVDKILCNLANVNTVNENGLTPLHCATKTGNIDIIRTLLNADANPNHADEACRTALHYAVEMNRIDVVGLLLEKGADVNVKDKDALTPFDYANENPKITNILEQAKLRQNTI